MRPVSFSTAGLPEAQKIARWEEHNSRALIGLRCRMLGEAALDATEVNLQLDGMHLARVRGNAHVVERPAAEVRRNPADAVAVYLTLVGEAFFYHDDGVLTLRPGQALICDADRPFMRGFSRGLEELAVKVRRPVFRSVTGLDEVRTPLVRDFGRGDPSARSFARLVDEALTSGGPVDEDVALELLASMTAGHDTASVHVANARTYIELHLSDPGLSAARVATAIGISERHLSRAFGSTGVSVPQFVLARRLDRAHTLLASAPGTPVSQVAARCGFGSAAHFSQTFRARYGRRPSDVRREARAALPGNA
ncbi:helix-turn-helix domain-containing protein [Actinoplanes sp. NPDC089786]|uniref:helix-turn-helix domain-containing protein n=1 Tax=Actinoplanes sp. NPDC089786 TaxID=3155185 RepID=UPI003418ED91